MGSDPTFQVSKEMQPYQDGIFFFNRGRKTCHAYTQVWWYTHGKGCMCKEHTRKSPGTTPDVLQSFPFFPPSIWDRVSQGPGAVAHLPS